MPELHNHYCKRCNTIYSCAEARPIDASKRGGPEDSNCFHHYAVPHQTCASSVETEKRVVVGGA